MIKLILQGLGSGRNDGLLAAHRRRQKVRKCFAGAGARLYNKLAVCGYRLRNRLCHPGLSGTRLKAGQQRAQRARWPEKFSEVLHSGTIQCHASISFVLTSGVHVEMKTPGKGVPAIILIYIVLLSHIYCFRKSYVFCRCSGQDSSAKILRMCFHLLSSGATGELYFFDLIDYFT